MIKGGQGGGNTKTGLLFEGEADLINFLDSQTGYSVKSGVVYYHNEEVAKVFQKHGLYRFLEEIGIEWKSVLSKKLLPDNCLYVIVNNTLFVIEVKFQQVLALLMRSSRLATSRRNNIKNSYHVPILMSSTSTC